MKKIILILSIVCVGSWTANAQDYFVSFQYSMGFAMGDMGKHISKPSFRGGTFDWRKFVNPNMGIGLEIGWNVFYEAKPSDLYTIGTATLTGKQYRYQNQAPILVSFDYYLSPGEKFNPFGGVGVGTMYSRRNTDMSTYTLEEESWHFALKPEVGFLYQLDPEVSVLVALKYYYGLQAGDLTSSQSYLSLNVGLAFTK